MTRPRLRPRRRGAIVGLALALALSALPPGGALAEPVLPADFASTVVAGGLDGAVNFDFLPDGRVLVVEQVTARIRLVVPGAAVQPGPVGTVADVRTGGLEEGLLGIAVDPRWPARPYVYVHHAAASSPNLKVARYALTGDLAFAAGGALALDTLSRRDVLGDLPDDFPVHDGGTLEFGPDDLLYVALGDDFVNCAAQDPHQLRGKILRLDVRGIPDGPGPVPSYASLAPPGNPFAGDLDPRARLVWHRGLRNPWSFDFDPRTGVMAIADVGESGWEEIDLAGDSGRNFGWPIFEGNELFQHDCEDLGLGSLSAPIHVYAHDPGAVATTCILGGICHRADAVAESFPPEYWGNVFFLDFYDGRLRRLAPSGDGWAPAPPVPGQPDAGAWGTGFAYVPRMRFGRDGGLWYLQGGELRRIGYQGVVGVPVPPRSAGASRLALAAWPTPSAGAVTLEFHLDGPAAVELAVFDVAGRRVRRLAARDPHPAGTRRIAWDGRDDAGRRVRPGIYRARLASGGETAESRLVLVASAAPDR